MADISSTTILASSAARAYKSSQTLGAQGATTAAQPQAATAPQSFADMVRQTAEQAVRTVQEGDAAAQAGLTGTMPTQQVIEATMALESTVRTTVAMRDKLVEAYRDVLNMQM
ncbi:flagellar hook-basal body complex protein FliE [Frigidibacter sp. MR17.14]|uniref:flagellar hook-basal body complex protein FliE n=1 Tax=Frigidibacter sp. MR17.14 TaxID=3126509 RepID=UPI003012D752